MHHEDEVLANNILCHGWSNHPVDSVFHCFENRNPDKDVFELKFPIGRLLDNVVDFKLYSK